MSRHEFTDDAGVRWTVGWDEPLVSYFAQRDTADGEVEDLAGTSIGEVTTFDALLERLHGHVELPDEIREKLAGDAPAFTAAPIAAAIARQDQLGAFLRDGMNGPAQRPEVER